MTTPINEERLKPWLRWLDGPGLDRINHLRERAGEEPLTLRQAAVMCLRMKYESPDQFEQLKARIA